MLPNMEGGSGKPKSMMTEWVVPLRFAGEVGRRRATRPYRKILLFIYIFLLLWSPVCSIGLLLCHVMALSEEIPSEW